MSRVCAALLALAVCVSFVGAGVELLPRWEQGQRLRFGGLTKTHINTEFDGHMVPTVMDTTMRSELLVDVVELRPSGGAVVEIWWDWIRIEMDSTTLVESVVFDSREADQATGLVAQTFGPLTEMIREKVRIEIDGASKVTLIEPAAATAHGEGAVEFDEIAGRSFGHEAVRYMVQNLLVWSHPGETELGDSWAVMLPSGEKGTCTFDTIKEVDGERYAILRTEIEFDKNKMPDEVAPGGERLSVEHRDESYTHAISIGSGMVAREESKMRVATRIEASDMVIKSDQEMHAITTLLATGLIDDEGELDLDRHAEGE